MMCIIHNDYKVAPQGSAHCASCVHLTSACMQQVNGPALSAVTVPGLKVKGVGT